MAVIFSLQESPTISKPGDEDIGLSWTLMKNDTIGTIKHDEQHGIYHDLPWVKIQNIQKMGFFHIKKDEEHGI